MKGFIMPPEMKTACIWIVWAFLAVGAVGWPFFVLLNAFDAKQDAAAWVQAIGSVAAVAMALFVANKQARETAKARRTRESVILKLVSSVARNAATTTANLFNSFDVLHSEDKAAQVQLLSDYEQQLILVRGINPVELPVVEMLEPFIKMRGAMEVGLALAKLLAEGGKVDRLACATTLQITDQIVNGAAEILCKFGLD